MLKALSRSGGIPPIPSGEIAGRSLAVAERLRTRLRSSLTPASNTAIVGELIPLGIVRVRFAALGGIWITNRLLYH
jgi:hypothetical protein